MECRVCHDPLSADNWHPSRRKTGQKICKDCLRAYVREWKKRNPKAVAKQKQRAKSRARNVNWTPAKIEKLIPLLRSAADYLESLLP